ncbi:MAG: asparaginase [Acidimicrobiia bacterium]|nr:asparaginase [Acidimicrobiia bacterium]
MRFSRVRSGLPETIHEVAGCAIDRSGTELMRTGPVERPFYYRSAIKPLQALASLRAGASLADEELAIVCSSHGGYPVHLSIVESILANHGLSEADLRCPPALPLNPRAQRLQVQLGHTDTQRLFHNCSGKHAGWLAGSAARGWPTDTYLDPRHPMQRAVYELVESVTEAEPGPVGVDGCGSPTLRGTVITLARAFRTVTTTPEFARIATAMMRFPALVSDNVRPDGVFGVLWGGTSKGGAEGLFAASRNGITITTKSLDGSIEVAVAGAVEIARSIGALPRPMARDMEVLAHPPVLGGGEPVGTLELVEP